MIRKYSHKNTTVSYHQNRLREKNEAKWCGVILLIQLIYAKLRKESFRKTIKIVIVIVIHAHHFMVLSKLLYDND